ANHSGSVVALHTSTSGFTRALAQESLAKTLDQEGSVQWWYGGGHLYEVFLKPIYFGPASDNKQLGFLAVGYEIDGHVAAEVGQISGSQVAFYYGDDIVRSTLPPKRELELSRAGKFTADEIYQPVTIQLGSERFLATSLDLAPGKKPP